MRQFVSYKTNVIFSIWKVCEFVNTEWKYSQDTKDEYFTFLFIS